MRSTVLRVFSQRLLLLAALGVVGCGEPEHVPDPCAVTPDATGALPTQLTAGDLHFCAVHERNGVRCWGANDSGQSGRIVDMSSKILMPTDVSNLGCVSKVAAMGDTTCAVLEAGDVRCWGSDSFGQLGNGSAGFGGTPVRALFLHDVSALSGYGLCLGALTSDQSVYTWGLHGDIVSESPRKLNDVPSDVQSFAINGAAICAVHGGGSLWCSGTLGLGHVASDFPGEIDGISDARSVAMTIDNVCVIQGNGTLLCWGDNDFGQVGDGTLVRRETPTPVIGLDDVVQVAMQQYTCALQGSGSVWCWGLDTGGTLGPNGTRVQLTPVPVPIPATIVEIAAGLRTVCALDDQGTIWCWGQNQQGQFGNGTISDIREEPGPVSW